PRLGMRTCPCHRPNQAWALARNLFIRGNGQGDARIMSERPSRSGSAGRMSSAGAAARTLRRVRVMSAGRWHAPMEARPAPLVIAVGAAKAGVGKSIVACNLAASVAGLGRRVVVVDLDFRAPRQHKLFGAAPPEGGLPSWLDERHARRE